MENEIFENEKVSKAYIRLSLPLVFSLVVTLIYNLADTFLWRRQMTLTLLRGFPWGCLF